MGWPCLKISSMLNLFRYAMQLELLNLKSRRRLFALVKTIADQEGKRKLDREIEEIDRGIESLQ
jgi:hypothetical protein